MRVSYDEDNDILNLRFNDTEHVTATQFQGWLLETREVTTGKLVALQINGLRAVLGITKKLVQDAEQMGPNEWDEYIEGTKL